MKSENMLKKNLLAKCCFKLPINKYLLYKYGLNDCSPIAIGLSEVGKYAEFFKFNILEFECVLTGTGPSTCYSNSTKTLFGITRWIKVPV